VDKEYLCWLAYLAAQEKQQRLAQEVACGRTSVQAGGPL